MGKSDTLTIRISPRDRELITGAAEVERKSVSQFLRDLAVLRASELGQT